MSTSGEAIGRVYVLEAGFAVSYSVSLPQCGLCSQVSVLIMAPKVVGTQLPGDLFPRGPGHT